MENKRLQALFDNACPSIRVRAREEIYRSPLSDGERQIVALHAVAGLRHRQIAALLELPLSTVLSKYARAIKKLKQYLQ